MKKMPFDEDAPPISFFFALIGFVGLVLVGIYKLMKLVADQGWLAGVGWGCAALFAASILWLLLVDMRRMKDGGPPNIPEDFDRYSPGERPFRAK